MISAILLSGGVGKRFLSPLPKQYLPLCGKPLILHALEALLQFPAWEQVVVVCEEAYRTLFLPYQSRTNLCFATPGPQRQDSVFSGCQALSSSSHLLCIHDGARPLLQSEDLFAVIQEGKKKGAAALAIPVKTTIKEVDAMLQVKRTLDRSLLWEMQTPQVIEKDLFLMGYQALQRNSASLSMTDDVGFAELLGHLVQIVPGSESNIKITTPEDLAFAELWMKQFHG